MRLQWPKKSEKSAKVVARSRYEAKGSTPGCRFSGTRAPGSRPFRVRKPVGKELKENKNRKQA